MFAEDFAGVVVDDGDGVGVDEDGYGLAFVGGADAEMVHAAGWQCRQGVELDLVQCDVLPAP